MAIRPLAAARPPAAATAPAIEQARRSVPAARGPLPEAAATDVDGVLAIRGRLVKYS
jgi:hypothetical protein